MVYSIGAQGLFASSCRLPRSLKNLFAFFHQIKIQSKLLHGISSYFEINANLQKKYSTVFLLCVFIYNRELFIVLQR